ncbi:MAG: Yip1 family protein [Nitrospirota bacterium]
MNLSDKIKNIILKPRETWPKLKDEQTTLGTLYIYAVILAAVPTAAKLIGINLIGSPMMEITYGSFSVSYFWSVVFSYILSLVGIKIISFIADALAPRFDSQRNMLNATKAVIYSWIPYWIAGILYLIPYLSVVVILASFYSIYVFWIGLPVMMGTPKDRATAYVIAVVVISTLVFFLMGATAGLILAGTSLF